MHLKIFFKHLFSRKCRHFVLEHYAEYLIQPMLEIEVVKYCKGNTLQSVSKKSNNLSGNNNK